MILQEQTAQGTKPHLFSTHILPQGNLVEADSCEESQLILKTTLTPCGHTIIAHHITAPIRTANGKPKT